MLKFTDILLCYISQFSVTFGQINYFAVNKNLDHNIPKCYFPPDGCDLDQYLWSTKDAHLCLQSLCIANNVFLCKQMEIDKVLHSLSCMVRWDLSKKKVLICKKHGTNSPPVAKCVLNFQFFGFTLLITDSIAFVNLAQHKLFPGTACIPPLKISAS